jgi:hypothetical protein
MDACKLCQELLLGGHGGHGSHGSTSSGDCAADLLHGNGGTSSSDHHHLMLRHRFASDMCNLGVARAVHWRVGHMDAPELRKELQPGLLFD